MLYESDEDGKYKLTGPEYSAVLTMMCAVDTMISEASRLEERIKLLPYGWRDYKMIIKRLGQLSEDILVTVPIKRLRTIREELKNMEIRATLKGVTGDKGGGVVCVNTNELMAVIDEIVSMRASSARSVGRILSAVSTCISSRTASDMLMIPGRIQRTAAVNLRAG